MLAAVAVVFAIRLSTGRASFQMCGLEIVVFVEKQRLKKILEPIDRRKVPVADSV